MVINGFGTGTDHFGGFAEKASVRNEWLMPLPKSLSALDAAKIGTAGYTAMLCVDALRNGIKIHYFSTYHKIFSIFLLRGPLANLLKSQNTLVK